MLNTPDSINVSLKSQGKSVKRDDVIRTHTKDRRWKHRADSPGGIKARRQTSRISKRWYHRESKKPDMESHGEESGCLETPSPCAIPGSGRSTSTCLPALVGEPAPIIKCSKTYLEDFLESPLPSLYYWQWSNAWLSKSWEERLEGEKKNNKYNPGPGRIEALFTGRSSAKVYQVKQWLWVEGNPRI